jgi:hypothetical protein
VISWNQLKPQTKIPKIYKLITPFDPKKTQQSHHPKKENNPTTPKKKTNPQILTAQKQKTTKNTKKRLNLYLL